MTTIEKLFVQIFERKKWIVDQVKYQTDIFDQQLASKCFLHGIAPPPWLWSPAFHSNPEGHHDLNKEELISGLLLPRFQPGIPYSTTRRTLYENPVVTADNVELPDGLYAGVHTLSKGFDAGNESSVLPQCSISDAKCAFNRVPELDFSVTSPQDCGDARSSDNKPEPALSLARIQRSKSRQKALELRNSAKASKSCLRDENGVGARASRFEGSRISFLQSDHVDESELVKPVDVCNETCAVEEEKVGDHRGKERVGSCYSGRITRSRSSGLPPRLLTEHSKLGNSSYISKVDDGTLVESISRTIQQPNHVNESLEKGSFGLRKAIVGVNQRKEKGSSGYCGRITRSRSVKVFPKLESSSNIEKDHGCPPAESSGKSVQPPQPLSWTRGEGETDLQNAQGHQLSAVRLSPSQKDSEACAASAREHLGKVNSVERGVAQNTGSQANCTIERIAKAVDSNISGHIVIQSRFAASNKSQNEQTTEISEERSLPGRKDLELCIVGSTEHLDKENIVDHYAGRITRPETTCIIEGTVKPVNSKTLGCRVTGSKSTASNKSLLAKSLNRFEGVDLQEALGAQVNVLPCPENSDNIDLEIYDEVVAETDTDSDGLLKARFVSSRSNLEGASLRAGLEDLVSRELPECTMLVKPKQLDFDDVEEYSLNETSSPVLEKKKEGMSSEKRPSTLLHSVDILDKLTTVHYQENCNSSLEIPLPEEQEVLSKDEKVWRGSSEAHAEETDGGSRTTNLNAGSSVKETSEVYIDAVTHTSQERNKISKQQLSLIDHSIPVQVAHDNSLGIPLKDAVGSNLSNVTTMEFSFEKGIGEVDIVKPTKSVSEDSNLDTDACGGPKISADADFAVVTGSVPLRYLDITLGDFPNEYPSTVSVDEIKGNSDQQKMNSGCMSDDKNVICSKSSECLNAKKSIQPGLSFSFDMEGSWPQHKRRKVEGQLTDALSASPSLRVEDVVESNNNRSPVDEMNQNVERHMIGESESSPKLQVDEGELCMEEKDRSASTPFTSKHEEPGAPGDSHGCLVEDAVGSYLSNVNADTRIKFSVEQCIGELDIVKPTKSVSEDSNLDTDACGGPKISAEADFSVLTGSVPLRNPDITFRDFAIEYPSAVAVAEIKCNFDQQQMIIGCISDDKNAVSSKPSECLNAKKSIQPGLSFSFDMEGSWPQHKRRKVEGQLTYALSASPSLREEDVVRSNVNKSTCHMIGESESSPKLQVDEGELCMEEKDRCASTSFISKHEEPGPPFVSSLVNQAAGGSHGCLVEEAEVADPTSTIVDSRRQYALEENQDLENKIELGNTEPLTCSERSMQERKSRLGENGKFSYGSAGSPDLQSMALIGADQTMPEFEGFIMQDNEQPCAAAEGINFEKLDLPKSEIERASVLEQLCKSASIHTPLSHFSTTYNRTPNLYQSVPNGLLECMDPRSTLPVVDAFHGRSHSDCLPFSSTQSAWDIRKPYTSPVGKLWDRITSNCGSSERRGSLNPELPCISEENENPDEVADAFQEEDGPAEMSCSLKREPLADITENPNLSASVSEVEICGGRNSLDSVNTEFSFIGTHNMVKQKLGNHNSSNRRHTKKEKENGVKRASKSVRNRFSKPKLSGKNSLRKEGPSISGQESKRNNIVSNITSFIPLVQQKQAAAIITGKRDVKVKSLEAAEAVKRLQEKKENERKKKKEDLRLERARLEQENQRQLELHKKKKEEERKKKEADMAVRKRQREEEERKEKEKKRKRVEEARRQQHEHEEKLRARKDEKEMKCRTKDETVHERKVSKDETGKHKKMEKKIGDENLGKISEIEPRTSTSDAIKASIVPEDCEAWNGCGDLKVLSNIDKATENENLYINTSQEQSYEISPYKVSDDEDEDEEDDIPNTKFKPSWASKNRLAVVVSCQKRVDPGVIFPPESFCSIDEVILPRKHQLR